MKKILCIAIVCVFFCTGCVNNSKKENQIVVGLECNYAPFNWTQLDSKNGAVKIENGEGYCAGYDVEIAKLIAKDLGKELVIKKWTDFDALPAAINTGDIDLIIAGMSPSAERKKVIAFSDPYYFSDLVLVVKKTSKYAGITTLEGFSGAKVAAQIGTLHNDVIDQIKGVKHATPLSDFPTLTIAVKSGDIDAMISEKPVALAIVANNPDLVLVDFTKGFSFTTEEEAGLSVSVGLKKGKDDLLKEINKTLATLNDESRNTMMENAIKNQPQSEE